MCRTSRKSGALTYRIPMGLCRPVAGQLYFTFPPHSRPLSTRPKSLPLRRQRDLLQDIKLSPPAYFSIFPSTHLDIYTIPNINECFRLVGTGQRWWRRKSKVSIAVSPYSVLPTAALKQSSWLDLWSAIWGSELEGKRKTWRKMWRGGTIRCLSVV
jgi:hypothetical protein